MKSRAAVQTSHDGRLIVDEIEVPDPRPNQVVVKLHSTGVCHSQLHHMHDLSLSRPMALGHEAAGVVSRVGQSVGHLKEGDSAIVTWVPRTPRRGRYDPGPSRVTYRGDMLAHRLVYTWAEDALVDSDYVVRMSDDDPKDVSCIVGCAVLTGAGAVMNTARVRPGDSVAVFGVGGVGLSAVQMAAILEAYPIIAVDLDEEKLAFAREFGATDVVNASKVDTVAAVVDISGGGVDYAFDAIGVRATNEQILPSTRGGGAGADNHGGMAVLIGIPGSEMTLDPRMFVTYQRQFRGSLGSTYPDRDFALFLRWYREGRFPLDRLVTRRYSLDQINEACDALEAGEILGRAIVEF